MTENNVPDWIKELPPFEPKEKNPTQRETLVEKIEEYIAARGDKTDLIIYYRVSKNEQNVVSIKNGTPLTNQQLAEAMIAGINAVVKAGKETEND